MSQSTVKPSPLEYLAAAERELAADNPLEGSRLLWKAAEATFARLGKVKELDEKEIIALAKSLDQKEGRNRYYIGTFGVANALMHNAELDMMEDYELESAYDIIREFVREMV